MKKIIRDVIIAIILVFGPIFVFNLYSGDYSNHIFSDADNITSGELNSARLDPSSVTLQGNQWAGDISQDTAAIKVAVDGNTLAISSINAGTSVIHFGSITVAEAVHSTTGFIGESSTFTRTYVAEVSSSFAIHASSVMVHASTPLLSLSENVTGIKLEMYPTSLLSGTRMDAIGGDLYFMRDGEEILYIDEKELRMNKQIQMAHGGEFNSILGVSTMVVIGNMSVSSISARGVISSSSGFIGGSATFTYVYGNGSGLTNLPAGTQNPSTSTVLDNLIITTDSVSTNDWWVKADKINVMGDFAVSLSTICQLDVDGIGGIDTGSEGANKWYGLYIISNGSTMSIVASEATGHNSPTMPGGYTKWRRVGYVRNDSGSNLIAMTQRGRRATLRIRQQLVASADLSATPAFYDFTDVAPPNAISVQLLVHAWADTSTSEVYVLRADGVKRDNIGAAFGVPGDGGVSSPAVEVSINHLWHNISFYQNKTIIYYESQDTEEFYVNYNGWEISE